MKQEILCPDCKNKARRMFPTDNPYPGEHVKFQDGKAKSDYNCDTCNKPINTGESCTCLSMWADYGGVPYYPWEKDYIEEISETVRV